MPRTRSVTSSDVLICGLHEIKFSCKPALVFVSGLYGCPFAQFLPVDKIVRFLWVW